MLVRFGMEVFETFFDRTVGLCQQAGLVRREAAFVDSTLIQANAPLGSLEPSIAYRLPMGYSSFPPARQSEAVPRR